jgi:hypothetical protein
MSSAQSASKFLVNSCLYSSFARLRVFGDKSSPFSSLTAPVGLLPVEPVLKSKYAGKNLDNELVRSTLPKRTVF